jgi:hypothetical protein
MAVVGSDSQKSIDYSDTDKRVYWANKTMQSVHYKKYIHFFITDKATNPGFKCNWSIQKTERIKLKTRSVAVKKVNLVGNTNRHAIRIL